MEFTCVNCGNVGWINYPTRKYCDMKCEFEFKNKRFLAEKEEKWDDNKEKIIEMRKNGFSLKTLQKRFKLKGKGFLADKLKDVEPERNARSFYKVPVNLAMTPDLAYIMGVMEGDGWVTTYKHHQCENSNFNSYGLGVIDEDFADTFMEKCKIISLNPRKYKKPCKTAKQGFIWEIAGSSKIFVEFCRQFDKELVLSNDAYAINYLRGFFDSEGYFYKYKTTNAVSCKMSNCDRELLSFIEKLVSRFGFRYSIYENMKKFPNRKPFKLYDLDIRGGREEIRRFINLIQPSIKRKQWVEN